MHCFGKQWETDVLFLADGGMHITVMSWCFYVLRDSKPTDGSDIISDKCFRKINRTFIGVSHDNNNQTLYTCCDERYRTYTWMAHVTSSRV